MNSNRTSQRIATIGAGVAGLCAAKELIQTNNYKTVVYEATNNIGGTWFYTDDKGSDEAGYPVHSAMYRDLRVNIPTEVMTFPGFANEESQPSYASHDVIYKYLSNYCDHFGIRKYIKFCTSVTNVSPISRETFPKFPKWEVTSFHWKNKTYQTEIFDGVFVCTGKFSLPNIPEIEGVETFKGRMLHSYTYRTPEEFAGKKVVLLGGAASGIDIAFNLRKVAKEISLSHKGIKLKSQLPEDIKEEAVVIRITENGVVFEDGKTTQCDAIVFCTGYNYTFPFLTGSGLVNVEKNRVTPLYKHLFHIHYPNLVLVGIVKQVDPFRVIHCQISCAIGVLDGSVQLPSTEEMLKDEDDDYRDRIKDGNLPVRGAHILAQRQWPYCDELMKMCKKELIPVSLKALFDFSGYHLYHNVSLFRTFEYSLGHDGMYYLINYNIINPKENINHRLDNGLPCVLSPVRPNIFCQNVPNNNSEKQ